MAGKTINAAIGAGEFSVEGEFADDGGVRAQFAPVFVGQSASVLVLQCVAVCCRVLQSIAECCRVLQSVAECCRSHFSSACTAKVISTCVK